LSANLSSFVLGTLKDRCDLNKSRPVLLVTSCMVFYIIQAGTGRVHTERINRDARKNKIMLYMHNKFY